MERRPIEVDVMENYRTFETPDSYMTELPCSCCGQMSEQYIRIEGWIRVCKGCLSRWDHMLNERFQKHMKEAKRK